MQIAGYLRASNTEDVIRVSSESNDAEKSTKTADAWC